MKLPFDPIKHGWHFPANAIADAMGVKRSNGLCGGLSLSAVNYFRYGMNIPSIQISSKAADAKPVFNFILYSQFAVFESANILKQKTALLFPNTQENHHRISINDEFPKIKKALDDGCFVLLGLRSLKEDYKAFHQILVYGYDENNCTLYAYDSDSPDEEVVIKSNGYRLLFSNGKEYSSYYLLMTLNPGIKSRLNNYDSSKNQVYNFSVKPPEA
jgi:hypothetical protein